MVFSCHTMSLGRGKKALWLELSLSHPTPFSQRCWRVLRKYTQYASYVHQASISGRLFIAISRMFSFTRLLQYLIAHRSKKIFRGASITRISMHSGKKSSHQIPRLCQCKHAAKPLFLPPGKNKMQGWWVLCFPHKPAS